MSLSRSLLILAFGVTVACAAESIPDDRADTETPSITDKPAGSAASCQTNDEGCSCSATAPIACFSGPAELRGKNGCQDGTRTCTPRGEFSVWGPCVGEITACTAPLTDGGAGEAGGGPGPVLVPPPGGGSVPIAPPDYAGCTALPSYGKRGYGQCSNGQVVVIVNDGDAQEMTCCPVGANVLSTVPAEQQLLRTGFCLPDEVATGMADPTAPAIFCTKINTAYLKLGTPTTARYVDHDLPGLLGQIASSYHNNDTCICDEGSVVTGGHIGKNDVCTDRCVRIEKK
jgi:hypothetical protein